MDNSMEYCRCQLLTTNFYNNLQEDNFFKQDDLKISQSTVDLSKSAHTNYMIQLETKVLFEFNIENNKVISKHLKSKWDAFVRVIFLTQILAKNKKIYNLILRDKQE